METPTFLPPARARPEIDVEQLVIRVYRDQAADKSGTRFRGGAGAGSNLNALAFSLGMIIDSRPYVDNDVG